jgi:hypothetical protein
MLERLKEMLKDANTIVQIREESLFEAEVNFVFKNSRQNADNVTRAKERLAEKVNYRNVLAVKVRELETGVSISVPIEVTAMTVQNSLQL